MLSRPRPRAQARDHARSAARAKSGCVYARCPDIPLTTSTGARVRLSRTSGGRPLLLTFVFTRCAGVCSPFLRVVAGGGPQRSAAALPTRVWCSASIPATRVADMAMLAHHLDLEEDDDDWTFAVAEPADVRRLARRSGLLVGMGRAIGSSSTIPAMLAGIRGGRLVRLLVGGSMTVGAARRIGARSVGRVRAQLSVARPGAVPLRACTTPRPVRQASTGASRSSCYPPSSPAARPGSCSRPVLAPGDRLFRLTPHATTLRQAPRRTDVLEMLGLGAIVGAVATLRRQFRCGSR